MSAPTPQAAPAVEWEGPSVGLSNLHTKSRGFAPVVDDAAGAARLLASAREVMQGHVNFIHDFVLHGVPVRLFSNSFHLADFARMSLFAEEEWRARAGVEAMDTSRVTAYAYSASDQSECAYWSAKERMFLLFDNSWYGHLRAWMFAEAGRILADERGFLRVPGACVARGDRAALLVAPHGIDLAATAFTAMRVPDTRFVGVGEVVVRLTWKTKRGAWVSPVEAGGMRGWRTFKWIETHGGEADARVRAVGLDDRIHDLAVRDFDLAAPPRAFAYPVEKAVYVPTASASAVPGAEAVFLRSRLENAGESLSASAESRAMVDPVDLFGRPRVATEPLEAVPIAAVFVADRDEQDRCALESVPAKTYLSCLLREGWIAGRPDRLADAAAERAHAAAVSTKPDPAEAHAEAIRAGAAVPESLAGEIEMHRVLAKCAKTYGLNLALPSPEAAGGIVGRVLATLPDGANVERDRVAAFIEGAGS